MHKVICQWNKLSYPDGRYLPAYEYLWKPGAVLGTKNFRGGLVSLTARDSGRCWRQLEPCELRVPSLSIQGKTFKIIITNTRSFWVQNKVVSSDMLWEARGGKCRTFLFVRDSLTLSSPGWPWTHRSDFAFAGVAGVWSHRLIGLTLKSHSPGLTTFGFAFLQVGHQAK